MQKGGPMNRNIFCNVVLSLLCMTVISVPATSFAAASSPSEREGKWESFFVGNYVDSTSIDFGGGANVDINGDLGFLFGFGYNFNEKLALDFQMAWNSVSYTGTRVSDTGATQQYGGTLDTSSTLFNLTYHFMAQRLTPFIGANAGWSWIDTNIPAGPITGACWWDPWYGYVCSGYQPTYTSTDFTYGASLGLRFDVSKEVFFRGSAGKQWIDNSRASSTPDFTNYRFDLGFFF
jgi:opacity protein-like surface antigen